MRDLGARRSVRYQRALLSVQHIVASRRVTQFCVGISGNPASRRQVYERWCRQNNANLDGFVLLDWGHSPDEIVRFERWLFEQTCNHPKYANVENIKYFPNVNRRLLEQAIYVAWWSPGFCNG
ncbi:MAG: hypothetical protein KKA16_09695 [Alphaproteobacteria bacterium]|nr:hypothetical protein [Alphaproteobacteria bacterium]MBU2378888.1 hypothetical protein [Alphaproteobacteria bacterium]